MPSKEHHRASDCGCGACSGGETAVGGPSLTRRGLFYGATALALAAAPLAVSTPAGAQSVTTPDEALGEMMAGNERFVAGQYRSPAEDLAILKQKNAEGQEPFGAVLACADSRVPVEILFDQSIGHLFVVRIAGNIVTPEVIASLEYGVAVLGTKAIMVLGHSNCGAVKATIGTKDVPGQIGALYMSIWPAVHEAGTDLAAVTEANARIQTQLLSNASPVIAAAIKAGTLKVVAALYDIATGRVTQLS